MEKKPKDIRNSTFNNMLQNIARLDLVDRVGMNINDPSTLFNSLKSDIDITLSSEVTSLYEKQWLNFNFQSDYISKMAILQPCECDAKGFARNVRFSDYQRVIDFMEDNHVPFTSDSYEFVFIENASFPEFSEDKTRQLNKEMWRFSGETLHPANHYGMSLSKGNIIVFMKDVVTFDAFFVDTFGFKQLPDNFLTNECRDKIRLGLDVKEEYDSYHAIYKASKTLELNTLHEAIKDNQRFQMLEEYYTPIFDFKEELAQTKNPFVTSKIEQESATEKKHLLVDIDGTLAEFKPVDTLETLYEPGYFYNLKPVDNVIEAVKIIIKERPDVEVSVLSSVLSDSPYAIDEKNAWVDKHLPEVDRNHRYYPPCGTDKKDAIPGEVGKNHFLLDDYTKNLKSWEPPAIGIKLLNGINHTNETWQNNRISAAKSPEELANSILTVIDGGAIADLKYNQTSNLHKDTEPKKTDMKLSGSAGAVSIKRNASDRLCEKKGMSTPTSPSRPKGIDL